ncbi:MAG: hypothetical protein DRJ34_05660 [Thermoprotei archaeon]|nr:MAG: hypothetical protein DRJ34_05660 [Thermoprotei archaeon]
MDENVAVFFNKQIDIEVKNAEMLRESIAQLKNILIKKLFESIAHDSIKHAGIYRSLINISSTTTEAIDEGELKILRNIVEKHIRIEENMIKNIRHVLEKGVDKRIEYVLKYILEDEYRHHAFLKGMLNAVVKEKVASEEEWWNIIWKTTFSEYLLSLSTKI